MRRGIALLILNLGSRWNCQLYVLTRFAWQGTPVTAEEEAGWASETFPTVSEENRSVTHTGIRTPDRSARSESLYRLRYPGYNIRICFEYTFLLMSCVLRSIELVIWETFCGSTGATVEADIILYIHYIVLYCT